MVVDPCTNLGDTSCADASNLQECVEDNSGCLYWEKTDCGQSVSNGICDSGGSAAACVDACLGSGDACTTLGTKECNGDTYRECVDAGGCLVWQSSDCTNLPFGGCDDSSTHCNVSY